MIGDADFWSGIGWTILTSALTSTAVVGLIGIALKSVLDRRNNAELERLKADLGRENNTQLERFKAELSRESARDLERIRGDAARELESYKQRVTLLASRQAEGAVELIKLVTRLNDTIIGASHPSSVASNPGHHMSALWNNLLAVQDFVLERGLLFPSELIPPVQVFIERALDLHRVINNSELVSLGAEEDRRRVDEAVQLGATELLSLTEQCRNLLQGKPISGVR